MLIITGFPPLSLLALSPRAPGLQLAFYDIANDPANPLAMNALPLDLSASYLTRITSHNAFIVSSSWGTL